MDFEYVVLITTVDKTRVCAGPFLRYEQALQWAKDMASPTMACEVTVLYPPNRYGRDE